METKSSRGFTLIEIVLVLAIAGLIFIIIFLALSNAQTARRDTQRKQDAGRFAAGLERYSSVNKLDYPRYPVEHTAFIARYFADEKDPLTGSYDIPYRAFNAPHGDKPAVGQIFFQLTHKCSDSVGGDPIDSYPGGDTNFRKYTVIIGLENGEYYCIDNQ